MLRIDEILLRMQIRESIPLTKDPDPAILVSDLQGIKSFFANYFLKVHLHHFSKIKGHKEVTKP